MCAFCVFVAASGWTWNRTALRRVGLFLQRLRRVDSQEGDPFERAVGVQEALFAGQTAVGANLDRHGGAWAPPLFASGVLGLAILAALARRDEVRAAERTRAASLDSSPGDVSDLRKQRKREWVLVLQPGGPCLVGVRVHARSASAPLARPARPAKCPF